MFHLQLQTQILWGLSFFPHCLHLLTLFELWWSYNLITDFKITSQRAWLSPWFMRLCGTQGQLVANIWIKTTFGWKINFYLAWIILPNGQLRKPQVCISSVKLYRILNFNTKLVLKNNTRYQYLKDYISTWSTSTTHCNTPTSNLHVCL